MENTISGWLIRALPEEYYVLIKPHLDRHNENRRADSAHSALDNCVNWESTEEGFSFWEGVYLYLSDPKYLTLPIIPNSERYFQELFKIN